MPIRKTNDNDLPKKHIVNVIKNNGSPNSLIYKYYLEDFNNNSTVIVDEGQEAIFLKGGVIAGVLKKGSHTLNTDNVPFLTRVRTIASGGESKYNCKIYFIRTSMTKEYKWGTSEAIQVRDPIENIFTNVRANGAYALQVVDSEKFFSKLVGSLYQTFDENNITDFFRTQFGSEINLSISKYIENSNREIVGIASRTNEIADIIKPHLANIVQEYGLLLRTFVIKSISIDMDEFRRALETSILNKATARREYEIKQIEAAGDTEARKLIAAGNLKIQEMESQRDRIKKAADLEMQEEARIKMAETDLELQKINAEREKVEAESGKEVASILEMPIKDKKLFDIMNTYANNPNGAPAAAVITGLENGYAMSGMMNNLFSNNSEKEEVKDSLDDFVQRNDTEEHQDIRTEINALKMQLQTGIISEAEYNIARNKILEKYGL